MNFMYFYLTINNEDDVYVEYEDDRDYDEYYCTYFMYNTKASSTMMLMRRKKIVGKK